MSKVRYSLYLDEAIKNKYMEVYPEFEGISSLNQFFLVSAELMSQKKLGGSGSVDISKIIKKLNETENKIIDQLRIVSSNQSNLIRQFEKLKDDRSTAFSKIETQKLEEYILSHSEIFEKFEYLEELEKAIEEKTYPHLIPYVSKAIINLEKKGYIDILANNKVKWRDVESWGENV